MIEPVEVRFFDKEWGDVSSRRGIGDTVEEAIRDLIYYNPDEAEKYIQAYWSRDFSDCQYRVGIF